MEKVKEYLGDSVYAEFDGFFLELYTDNGFGRNRVTTIYLEPPVMASLVTFWNWVTKPVPAEDKKDG